MRRAVSVAALVLAALAGPIAGSLAGSGSASAAVPTATARAPTGVDPRVFVIGDSVILGAHDALVGRLAAWQVTFIAKESFFTWQAPAAITAYHAGVGDISIVALGNNDGEDPGQFAREIDQVMAAFGPVRKVLWVNLRQFRPWVPAANAQLVAATARHPNLEIVDWDARATPDPALVYTDGLHLNPAGRAAMATLVGDRVDAAAAQLTAPPSTVPPATAPPATAPPATAPAATAPPATAPPATVAPVTPAPARIALGGFPTPVAPAAVVNVALAARRGTSEPTDSPSTAVLAAVGAAVLIGAGAWWGRREKIAANP